MNVFKRMINKLGMIGASDSDDATLSSQRRYLIYMAVLMSFGGLLWGSLCLVFGFYEASIIPFGYIIITLANLNFLSSYKNFRIVRSIQVSLSLLLPVIFQIMLGGFVRSGAVMLWSMLALGGSLAFSDAKLSLIWLSLFVVSTLICGLYDETARLAFETQLDPQTSVLFFVINISVITSIFFILIILLINAYRKTQGELERSNQQVHDLAVDLEKQVLERTSELQDSLAQTRAIVDHLNDGLVAIDLNQQITAINPSLCSLFAIPQNMSSSTNKEITKESYHPIDYRSLPDALCQLLEGSIAEKNILQKELQVHHRTLIATASPIISHSTVSGQVMTGCVVLARDISSERKLIQVQKQLEVSERMSALGTLAAGIAHEINNPLTYVISNLEMMIEDLQVEELTTSDQQELHELGRDALEGAERVSNVVQELRSFMKSRQLELGATCLTKVIKSALKLVQHELKHRVKVEMSVADKTPLAYVDERQLVQVLVNLLINASQAFTKKDLTQNRIWIHLSSKEWVDEVAGSKQEQLVLTIRDNACGMPAEVAKRVFDPFFTTKTAVGTGLGLAICHRIVSDIGGSISLTTQEGEGTCFTLILPAATDKSITQESVKTKLVKQKVNLQHLEDVVVIDDERSVGQVITRILGKEKVRFYTKSKDALQAIKAKIPQLIICDIIMPEMNGVEVYKELKSLNLQHLVFFITGGSTSDLLTQFIEEESPTLLYKPFSPQELRAQVAHHLLMITSS